MSILTEKETKCQKVSQICEEQLIIIGSIIIE